MDNKGVREGISGQNIDYRWFTGNIWKAKDLCLTLMMRRPGALWKSTGAFHPPWFLRLYFIKPADIAMPGFEGLFVFCLLMFTNKTSS
jgi:hypothetical protein